MQQTNEPEETLAMQAPSQAFMIIFIKGLVKFCSEIQFKGSVLSCLIPKLNTLSGIVCGANGTIRTLPKCMNLTTSPANVKTAQKGQTLSSFYHYSPAENCWFRFLQRHIPGNYHK